MYEQLSGGITFIAFDSIKSKQIGELALALSEDREPAFDFDPSGVLSRDPNEWNERFYIVMGDNPFISEERLRQVRSELHSNMARLFKEVWAKEKRKFEHWYELERTGFQRHLLKAAVKHKRDREETVFSYQPSGEPPLEALDKILPSFPEMVIASIEHIMQFPRDGGMRSREEQAQLGQALLLGNRIADAPFVKLQSLMFAAIAMRAAHGQKEPPNEGNTTDIDTVAHLLPYCDAMFMDNGCRSLLLDLHYCCHGIGLSQTLQYINVL